MFLHLLPWFFHLLPVFLPLPRCALQPALVTPTCECQCQCCSDPHGPYQPLELTESGVARAYLSKERSGQVKSYSRRIQPSWYKSFPWISVCTSSFKIYCTMCRSAKFRNLLSFPKHQKSAFVEDGFMNWKKALQWFNEHESSVMHRETVLIEVSSHFIYGKGDRCSTKCSA